MTRLFNPLDAFSSYSVHYVMLACRSTVAAEAFTDESDNAASLAAIEQVKLLGEPVPYGDRDKAYLIMDTRRFSQFTISDLKYDVAINGIEKAGSPGNLANLVNMTIVDSVGISFLNFLQWLFAEKMQTNADGVIYLLRIIFVGHTPEGKTETVQTVTIPMHMVTMELNLDFSKGVYNIEFMPNMNFNTDRFPRWTNIGDATSYFTGKGTNKLGALVQSFQDQLNEKSAEFYNKISANVKGAGGDKFGRRVEYMITIPEEWEKFEFNGSAMASATETIFKKPNAEKNASKPTSKMGEVADSNLSVEPGLNITTVLDIMFQQVSEISELAAGIRKEASDGNQGFVTFYKHFVGITSSDDVVVVHVDVLQYFVPDVSIQGKTSVGVAADKFYQTTEDGKQVPANYAEFDFIYTGKNADILNFDMKFEQINFLFSANLNLGAGAVAAVISNGQTENTTEPVEKPPEVMAIRAYDPILMPIQTKAELENFSRFASLTAKTKGEDMIRASQDATRKLSMYYAISPISVVMTIRGNPLIMAKFNQSLFLPHVTTGNSGGQGGGQANSPGRGTSDKAQYRKDLMKQIISDQPSLTQNNNGSITSANTLGSDNYATQPVFVKVNVKGPNVDFRTSDVVQDGEFSKAILNDNYYRIMEVTNHIQSGVFTQEIKMLTHNIFSDSIKQPEKQAATLK